MAFCLRRATFAAAVGACLFHADATASERRGLARHTQPNWQAGAAYENYSGDYGGDTNIRTTSLSFTGKRLFGKKSLGVTVPFVSNTSVGGVTLVGGRPVPNRGRGRQAPKTGAATSATEETKSGLGDIVVRGEAEICEESGPRPQVTGALFMKTPTGDRNKGLGTGQFDFGTAADLYKEFTPLYFGTMTLGYTFIGSPPDINYNDKWEISLGAGRVLMDGISISVIFSDERAISPAMKNPMSIALGLNLDPKPVFSFHAGLQYGLSDGAPDHGFTISGFFKF